MSMSLFSSFLNLFFPRRCVICGEELHDDEPLICLKCNIDFPRTYFWNDAYDNAMARQFFGIVPIEKCAALFFFTPRSRSSNVIYEAKYNSNHRDAYELGRMMAEEMIPSGFFEGIDALVFVPLSCGRLMRRGYNQSELIARGVAKVTGLKVLPNVLSRIYFRESQTKMSLVERRENVSDVFRLVDSEAIRGKHLLLIDDVVTTGATVQACMAQLLAVDGVRISVLSAGYAGVMKYPILPQCQDVSAHEESDPFQNLLTEQSE